MADLSNIPKQSNFEVTLASPIDSSQTTGITLTDVPDYTPAGETVRITILDPKNIEHITCTGWSSTTNILSGVTRGVAAYTGGASTAAAHGAGVKVVIGNPWQLYSDIATAINSKVDESGGVATTPWTVATYANLATLQAAYAVPTDGMEAFCTAEGKFYDGIGGSWVARESGGTFANASTTVAGKVEEATVAEQGSATGAGATGARLFPAVANLVKTSSGAGDENKIAILGASGKFATGFIDYSQDVTGNTTGLQYVSLTAGENLDGTTTPVAVYISDGSNSRTAGRVYKADADDLTNIAVRFVGFVNENITAGNTIKVYIGGVMGGFTGLTPGVKYFLSTTAGGVSTTVYNIAVSVGYAISATQIMILRESLMAYATHSTSLTVASCPFDVETTIGFRPKLIIASCAGGSGTAGAGARSLGVILYGAGTTGGATFAGEGSDRIAVAEAYLRLYEDSSSALSEYYKLTVKSVADNTFTITWSLGAGSPGNMAGIVYYLIFG